MKKIAEGITQKLIEHQIVSEEDRAIYEYGFWQGMVLIVNTLSIMAFGLLLGMLWQSLVFTVAYSILRIHAGGYHAKTQGGCYILSMLLITTALLAIKWVAWNALHCLIITFLSGVIIFVLAPVEDHNKPLDEIEQKEYRKRSILIYLCLFSATLAFLLIQQIEISAVITVSISIASVMLVAGKVKNKINLNFHE